MNGTLHRQVWKSKADRGERISPTIPYGYMKSPDNPKQWIIDEAVADNVRYIFKLCLEGFGPTQIAKRLTRERILTPTAYFISIGKAVSNKNITDPYRYLTKNNCYLLWMKYETKKVRKKGQKRCNRYGYIASFKNCPLEHSAKADVFLFTVK